MKKNAHRQKGSKREANACQYLVFQSRNENGENTRIHFLGKYVETSEGQVERYSGSLSSVISPYKHLRIARYAHGRVMCIAKTTSRCKPIIINKR